jgi:chromosomal replication initiator protein
MKTHDPSLVAAMVLKRAERRLTMLYCRPVQLVPIIDSDPITPEYVKMTVSFVTSVRTEAMEGKTRKREVVEARQLAMDLIKQEFDHLSLKKIGEMFGGRDHTTVIHARKTVFDLNQTSKEFSRKYDNCRRRLHFLKLNGIRREPLLLPATTQDTH